MIIVGLLIGSYLLGAIPFGLLIAKWWVGIDVREHGSGNIGATNVYRVVGKPAGVLVFTLDVLKGFLPPFVAAHFMHTASTWQVLSGLCSIFGHSLSPFLGFKGGKSVATGLGVLFGLSWQTAIACFALWGVLLAITGYVSVSSIIAALASVPFIIVFNPHDTPRLSIAIAGSLLILYRHRSNLKRLREGTETSIRKSKSKGDGKTS